MQLLLIGFLLLVRGLGPGDPLHSTAVKGWGETFIGGSGNGAAAPTATVVATRAVMAGAQADGKQGQPWLTDPDIHGDKVVFTCEGDLWLGDVGSSKAVRLTRDEGTENNARFSPDGTKIAYTADYTGFREVYVMPAEGGAPKRITYMNDRAEMADWLPDGKSILFRSRGTPAWWAMYTVPVDGGAPVRFPLEFASHVSFAPDGNRFVFTRISRAGAPWARYQGGQKNDIWLGDLKEKKFKKVYESQFTDEYPAWGDNKLYFVADGENGYSIQTIGTGGGRSRTLAGPYPLELRSLHTDGKRLIYEKGTGLEMVDIANGQAKEVTFELNSDLIHTLPYLSPATNVVMFGHLGPTGKRLLVETRGQILSVPASKGDVRTVLAKDGVRYRLATYSPDAKHIAYISDEGREQQLYVADQNGLNPKKLTSDGGRQLVGITWSPDAKWIVLSDSNTKMRLIEVDTGKETLVTLGVGRSAPHSCFSPDSKWLVYDDTDRISYYNTITLYEIATGKKSPIGNHLTNDWCANFSTDGKWLTFLSNRNVTITWDEMQNSCVTRETVKAYLLALRNDQQSPFAIEDEEEGAPKAEPEKKDEKKEEPKVPFRIDMDGLYGRLIELPVPGKTYGDMQVIGDRVLLQAGNAITWYDLKDKKGGTVGTADAYQVSEDHKKLLLASGAMIRVVDVTASDVAGETGRVSLGNYQLRINPLAEWEDEYWDAWRLARDYFYVANMHGNDWPAVGQKYAKMLPSIRSRGELNELIRLLYAELSISHIGVGGGDSRSLYKGTSPAFLGCDLEPDKSGYYKIAHIMTGDGFSESSASPLAAPGLGVKAGDFLIEVSGVPATVGSDFMGALNGRAGQVVALKVNSKPTADGAKTIRIKPMGSDWQTRYYEWVKHNREYVDKASGGKVGYLHIPDMGDFGLQQFIKEYFVLRNKDALIVDDRFNGGGSVSTLIINVLKQKAVAFFNSRANVQPWTRQGDYFAGPMCCLLNEFSASNGEEFPHHFKALGLGPLIGRRSWGGEVGSDPGWPVADGGKVWISNYGAYTIKDGWIIEGHGVEPDYDVESDPNAWVLGKDPQLDKAVEVMLAELKEHPVIRPVQPPDPVKVKVKGK